MNRVHRREPMLAAALSLYPARLRHLLGDPHYVLGIDPAFIGLARSGDPLPGPPNAYVLYSYHQEHRPRAARAATVVMPYRLEESPWALLVAVHELAHVLEERLGHHVIGEWPRDWSHQDRRSRPGRRPTYRRFVARKLLHRANPRPAMNRYEPGGGLAVPACTLAAVKVPVAVSCPCGTRVTGLADRALRCHGCHELLIASVSRIDPGTGELLPLRPATRETRSDGVWEPATTPFVVAVRIRPPVSVAH